METAGEVLELLAEWKEAYEEGLRLYEADPEGQAHHAPLIRARVLPTRLQSLEAAHFRALARALEDRETP